MLLQMIMVQQLTQILTDSVIDLDVVTIIVTLSNDFNIEVILLNFFFRFGSMVFIFEVSNHLINVVNWVIRTNYIF